MRIAYSGLDLAQLIIAYKRDNVEGIESVLSEKRRDGKPRVTATKAIHKKIRQYIQQNIENFES